MVVFVSPSESDTDSDYNSANNLSLSVIVIAQHFIKTQFRFSRENWFHRQIQAILGLTMGSQSPVFIRLHDVRQLMRQQPHLHCRALYQSHDFRVG